MIQKLLTITETATLLGINRRHLYTLMQERESPPWLYVGKARRFRPEDVNEWLEARKAASARGD